MKKRGREIYNATCFKYSQQKVGEGPHTLLHEIQEQLRGTKLNIYLHTEYQSKLQDAQSQITEAKQVVHKRTSSP